MAYAPPGYNLFTVCNKMHGLYAAGSVLAPAFLTIELKACFNTGDLGSAFAAYFVRYSTHA